MSDPIISEDKKVLCDFCKELKPHILVLNNICNLCTLEIIVENEALKEFIKSIKCQFDVMNAKL